MSDKTCETCRFFKAPTSKDYQCGECRQHAPRYCGETAPENDWAVVKPTDWCGDWEEVASRASSSTGCTSRGALRG